MGASGGPAGVSPAARTAWLAAPTATTGAQPGPVHHIGIGRTYGRTHSLLLMQALDIRFINDSTGEFLRQLTLDPAKDHRRKNQHQKHKCVVHQFSMS